MSTDNKTLLLPAVIIAIGLSILGAGVCMGLMAFRASDKTVAVKGLATKDVEADLAIWTIKHTATGDDLASVQATIKKNGYMIRSFLKGNGIAPGDISGARLEVTDLLAQAYRQNNASASRFIVSEVIAVRSNNVGHLDAAYQRTGELLTAGISLVSEQGSSPIEYIYTKLNEIKPEMIAQATKSARESAEQFAKDSGASVGAIKYANQGMFQIFPRDSENAYAERGARFKTVRVVATLNFEIAN